MTTSNREDEPLYTVAMVNYNMAGTLREAIESVLHQTDDRFEILIVDGGSDDGSLAVLEKLEREYDRVRHVALPPSEDRQLGADRWVSINEARGEYIVTDVDCDDVYREGLKDFVNVFHEIEEQLDFDFLLKGEALYMASRELYLEVPYRNITIGAENADLVRRMAAQDRFIELKHEPFWESIGYDKEKPDLMQRFFNEKVADFQSGISFWSYVTWLLYSHREVADFTVKKIVYDLLVLPLAYLTAQFRETHEAPDGFERKLDLPVAREERRRSLSQIEEEYGITVDRSNLSERGREIFYGDEERETSDGTSTDDDSEDESVKETELKPSK